MSNKSQHHSSELVLILNLCRCLNMLCALPVKYIYERTSKCKIAGEPS